MMSVSMKKKILYCYWTLLLLSINNIFAQSPVINVDFKKELGEMKPIWAWFGYDEPNYTYMKDGKKLLSELAALSPVPVFVRTHNLLTTGDGTPALKWGSTNITPKMHLGTRFIAGTLLIAFLIHIYKGE